MMNNDHIKESIDKIAELFEEGENEFLNEELNIRNNSELEANKKSFSFLSNVKY